MSISKRILKDTELALTIEEPMNMNWRESVAWNKGYEMGWKHAKEHYGVKENE